MDDNFRQRDLPDVANFDQDELIAQEKEMLGVYITAHPLEDYADMISRMVTVTSRQLAQVLDEESEGVMTEQASAEAAGTGSGYSTVSGYGQGSGYGPGDSTGAMGGSGVYDGMTATMAGIVIGKKNLITKNNKMMAFVDLEDLYGNVEVVVFPNVYEKYSDLLEEDRILAMTGRINFKEGEVPKLLADQIVDLRELKAAGGSTALPGNGAGSTGASGYGAGSTAGQPAQYAAAGGTGQHPGDALGAGADLQPEGLVKIRLPEGPAVMIRDMLRQITRIMKQHSGQYQAIVYLPPDREHPRGGSFRTTPDLWVDAGEMFRTRILRVVGEENYKD
jgi:DNA polymerase-3 subunit alpha